MPASNEPRTLSIARVLPADARRVYAALTVPDQLAAWWGPRGFSLPSVTIDLRAGGRYRIAMLPPTGAEFHLSGEFVEVDPPSRLVYTFRWDEPDPDDQDTLVTLTLGSADGRTELLMHQGEFATEARRALHRQGWSESLDKLEEYLLQTGS